MCHVSCQREAKSGKRLGRVRKKQAAQPLTETTNIIKEEEDYTKLRTTKKIIGKETTSVHFNKKENNPIENNIDINNKSNNYKGYGSL